MRQELQEQLRMWKASLKYPQFYVAVMKRVRFGIVDSDRANFLGLSFTVEIADNGGAALHLERNESLEMLEKHGSAENLENKLCWVRLDGTGISLVHFVKMVG